MDSPVRLELPRLSHLHLLELLLPLVPGIIVTTGLTLCSSPIALKFWGVPLGYKAKLALAIALAYGLGLAMMTIVQLADSIVMRLLTKPFPGQPWANPYWRKVIGQFVDSSLVPAIPSSMTPEELDKFVIYVSGIGRDQSLKANFSERSKSLQVLQQSLKKIADSTARIPADAPPKAREIIEGTAPVVSRASSTYEQEKWHLASTEEKIRTIVADVEWLSLYNALETLPNPKSPYGAFSLLLASLQSAAIGALWLVIQFRELRSPVAWAFWAVALLITSYGFWVNFQYDERQRNLASSQIGVMISKIRGRSGHEGSEQK
jgi:hypothetical protein